MKKILLLLALVFIQNVVRAQNLVPNPGFEIFSACPVSEDQLANATGWSDPTGTGPDYFNACSNSSTGYSVPDNDYGSMNAHGGNAYAGFFTYFSISFYSNVREYIQTQLTSPLEAGKVYNVKFYVARSSVADYAASTIGAVFTVNAIHPQSPTTGAIVPQVVNPGSNTITDATSWTEISGSFTADGGEQYLTIGNFNVAANSDPVYVGGSGNFSAYYYIDDISVVEDGTVGVNTPVSESVKVYPNPVRDNINLSIAKSLADQELTFALFDVAGRQVLNQTVNGVFLSVSCESVAAGIYVCKIMKDGKVVKTDKIALVHD